MPGTNEKSQSTVTLRQATVILGVGLSLVRQYVEEGVLRVQGPIEETMWRTQVLKEDVLNLSQVINVDHEQPKHLLTCLLIKTNRLEKELREIRGLLRLDTEELSLERKQITQMRLQIRDLLRNPALAAGADQDLWVRRLLAIDENYLDAVRLHTKSKAPWMLYAKLANLLCKVAYGERALATASYVRRNLRNVAYMYREHYKEETGVRFKDASFADRMLKTIIAMRATD